MRSLLEYIKPNLGKYIELEMEKYLSDDVIEKFTSCGYIYTDIIDCNYQYSGEAQEEYAENIPIVTNKFYELVLNNKLFFIHVFEDKSFMVYVSNPKARCVIEIFFNSDGRFDRAEANHWHVNRQTKRREPNKFSMGEIPFNMARDLIRK